MRERKLTLLNVYQGCGEVKDTIFLYVDYVDGKLDFENARDEVHRVKPHWQPYLGSFVPGATGWIDHVQRSPHTPPWDRF